MANMVFLSIAIPLGYFFLPLQLSFLQATGHSLNVTLGVGIVTLFFLVWIMLSQSSAVRRQDLVLPIAFSASLSLSLLFNLSSISFIPVPVVLGIFSSVFFAIGSYVTGLVYCCAFRAGWALAALSFAGALILAIAFLSFSGSGALTQTEEIAGSYYQFMGDIAAFLGIVVLVALRDRPLRYLILFVTVGILVGNNSRASLGAFAVAFLFLPGFSLLKFASLGIAGGTWMFLDQVVDMIVSFPGLTESSGRIVRTVVGLASGAADASASERVLYFRHALSVIADSPVSGEVGYELRGSGVGTYTHNLFHVWACYGLVPFMMLLWAMLNPLAMWWRERKHALSSGSLPSSFRIPVLVFVTTLLLLFRNPDGFFVFFLLGMANAPVTFCPGARRTSFGVGRQSPRPVHWSGAFRSQPVLVGGM